MLLICQICTSLISILCVIECTISSLCFSLALSTLYDIPSHGWVETVTGCLAAKALNACSIWTTESVSSGSSILKTICTLPLSVFDHDTWEAAQTAKFTTLVRLHLLAGFLRLLPSLHSIGFCEAPPGGHRIQMLVGSCKNFWIIVSGA